MVIYNKYRNKKTIVDGIKFDSIREGNRYCQLKILEKAGYISNLELQPAFDICPAVQWNGKILRKRVYKADFKYVEKGITIVEDVKGMRTKTYILKRSLFLTQYPEYNFKEI